MNVIHMHIILMRVSVSVYSCPWPAFEFGHHIILGEVSVKLTVCSVVLFIWVPTFYIIFVPTFHLGTQFYLCSYPLFI